MTLLNEADKVYIGTKAADKVYVGSAQVWPTVDLSVPFVTINWHSNLPRNDFEDFLGFQFTVGARPMIITELGKWIWPGNNTVTPISIVTVDSVILATGNLTPGTPGDFGWVALSPPYTAPAGATLVCAFKLPIGTDVWGEQGGSFTATADATYSVSVYEKPTGGFNVVGPTGPYGPVNFKYTLG